MPTSILAGIGWHMVGAASAASFYAPIEKVKKWSWETTWAVAGFFSWILLPIGVSYLLLPDFHAFYASIDTALLLKVALFGAMWGVGNVSYGLTMRHLGMSLGIGVAIGVTLVVGTLVPPLLHGQGAMLFTHQSGLFTMAGILVALIGVAVVSYAGHQKEMQTARRSAGVQCEARPLLAVLCGIFSSGMSFAIDAAKPMKAAALHLGVNPLYAALPSYVLIMGGGAVINLSLLLHTTGIQEGHLTARRSRTTRANAAQEWLAGCGGRHHVVSAILLLCVGRGQYSATAFVCELDAAHEHLRVVRRTRRPRARRVGRCFQATHPAALGGDSRDYCSGEPGGSWHGNLNRIAPIRGTQGSGNSASRPAAARSVRN